MSTDPYAELREALRKADGKVGIVCDKWRIALDSEVARQLLAERDSLLAERERGRHQHLVPGVMRCAKCEFQLIRKSLNLVAGTVTAGNSKTEPCPNGCGPLWPMAWPEYARQWQDAADQSFNEARQEAARLDWLESQINEHGQINLHDGSNPVYGALGLGLRPGSLRRTLREAIDTAMGDQQ